ncbi:MAG TPA: glycosyltransferase family 4 protein [Bacteroidota bacterium]
MERLIFDLVERHQPDVIYTHPIRMAQYTAALDSVPKVLDLTDALSLFLLRFRDVQKNPVYRWLLNVEFKRMAAYEKIISKFEKVLLCSKVDRDFIAERIRHPDIDLLYNGVDLEYFANGEGIVSDPHRIIFTGNMSYSPNAHAAEYFVRNIFPKIKARVPNATFFIVGQNPPKHVRALHGGDVVVTGFVDDIRVEYLKSAVAVSPVQFGSGTLNKVLEPMALGIPVVSTLSSVQGLELEHGAEIIVAAEPNDFADAVSSLLENPELRLSVGRAGMAKVRERFGWSRIAADLETMFQGLVEIHR